MGAHINTRGWSNVLSRLAATTAALVLLALPVIARDMPEPVAAFSFEGAADGQIVADIGDAQGTIPEGKFRIVDGVSGNAIAFDGEQNQAAKITGERLQSITDDLAISAWVRMDEAADRKAPISRGWNWRLRIVPDIFEVTVGGDPWRPNHWQIYSGHVDADRWYHVFYQYSTAAREFSLYVNGERVDDRDFAETPPQLRDEGQKPLLLGADPANYNLFDGAIDELAVYHTILDDAQVQALYMRHAPAVAAEEWTAMLAQYDRAAREAGDEALSDALADLREDVAKVLDGDAAWQSFAATGERLESFARRINNAVIAREAAEAGTPDVACFAVDPFDEVAILPDSPIPVEALSQRVTLRGAPGEWLTASFVLRPLQRDVEALDVEISALTGESGEIAGDAVDLRAVKCWYQGTSAWSALRLGGERTPILVPELLLHDPDLIRVDEQAQHNYLKLNRDGESDYLQISGNEVEHYEEEIEAGNRARIDVPAAQMPVADDAVTLQPVTIEEDRNQQFWLTVRVPADAQAGEYAGTIAWSGEDDIAGEIEITLEVLPIDLRQPTAWHDSDVPFNFSVYYRAKLSPDGQPWIGSEFKSNRQMRVELRDQAEHGMDFIRNRIPLDQDEKMETFMAMCDEVGFDKGGLYYAGISSNLGAGLRTDSETIEMMKQRARKLMAIADRWGYEKAYTYAIDEARAPEVKTEKQLWKILGDMGVGVFVAGRHDIADVAGDELDMLVAPGKLRTATAATMHSHGHRIFSYGNPQSGPENPRLFRLNYGVRLWKHNYDGAMTYAYQSAFGNVWNDFDGHVKNYRDHQFTYPTTGGIVGTMAWEGYRQAKQDVMYASLLHRLVRECSGSEDTARAATALEAGEWLEGLMPDAETDLVAMRARMIDYILRLQG